MHFSSFLSIHKSSSPFVIHSFYVIFNMYYETHFYIIQSKSKMQSKGRLGIRCFNSVEIVFNNFDKPSHKVSYGIWEAELAQRSTFLNVIMKRWRKLQESSYLLMVLRAHPFGKLLPAHRYSSME